MPAGSLVVAAPGRHSPARARYRPGAQQTISFTGTVQWASSTGVQVMADSGASVPLDLDRIDQTSYTSLRGGDRLRVYGYLAPDRRRVVAVHILREEFPQAP